MAHNHSCAQARLPGCECECRGARHGCQGAFEVADGSEDVVRAYVAQREEDWCTRPSGINRRQAAIGCARADVVHWLHRDRDLLKRTKTAQETAFEDVPSESTWGWVLRRLTEQLGPQRMQEFQDWAGQTHFWCELLAQMACAITHYEELRGRMFQAVEDAISQRDVQVLPDGLLSAGALSVAVQLAWRYLLASIVASSGAGSLAALLAHGNIEPLIWPIRVLAVLMCPDASRHSAVREYCWEPIIRYGSAEVRQEVRERLTRVFPDDLWFARRIRNPGEA